MVMRIYTKTGDAGETALFGGQRVGKHHVRVEAYGDVDELNASLGQARACVPPPTVDEALARIQGLLFELGGALATPPTGRAGPAGVNDDDVVWLERSIDAGEAQLPSLKSFVLPGGCALAAALHLCRCICRRAERRCVALCAAEPETSAVALRFLNRLSDYLFVLARLANQDAGAGDVPWRPRKTLG